MFDSNLKMKSPAEVGADQSGDREAAVERYTSRSFQQWEGSGVWLPVTGEVDPIDRNSLASWMGTLMGLGGASSDPGHTRLMVRTPQCFCLSQCIG